MTAMSAGAQSYWRASRSPRYSILFALPLVLGYEALSVVLPVGETHGVRNGAEVIMAGLFDAVAGRYGPAIFGALVIGICAWLIARDIRANGAPDRGSVYVLMMLESLLLAGVFAVIASTLTQRVLGVLHLRVLLAAAAGALDARTEFMVSLGAGVFEELLFRVVLVTVLMRFARVVFGAGPRVSGAFAVVGSAVLIGSARALRGSLEPDVSSRDGMGRGASDVIAVLTPLTRVVAGPYRWCPFPSQVRRVPPI